MECTIEGVQQLFDAVSEANGLPAFEFDETGACRIDTASGLSVHYQIRTETGDVVMLALLGTVPEAFRAEVFQAMLSANFYWQDTLGATLCWNERLDEAVLEIAQPAESLTAELLVSVMANFAELADIWKERLAAFSSDAETVAEAESELFGETPEEPQEEEIRLYI